ncbi:DUF4411 family protein [Ferroplasma sp.]|uniref:DUF4411 family protein n=1 Tax=Ferroplasma sp. TaxID=2591003 RepID=UPI00307D927B
MEYLIDTSSLIDLERRYPENVFKTLYNNIDIEISNGRLRTIEQVLSELKKGGDKVYTRFKNKKDFFLKTSSEIMYKAYTITANYPQIINNSRLNNTENDPADPYLIATSIILNNSMLQDNHIKIITEEDTKKNHIPDIAKKFNIECIRILKFFQVNNWEF